MEVGEIIEGKVSGITAFGAFVTLSNGKTGLVHISEVASTYVKDIKDHLKQNDKVFVKVLSINQNGKISLSIKKALEQTQKQSKQTQTTTPPAQVEFKKRDAAESLSFEDKMKSFIRDSDEKIAALKRYENGKNRNNHGHYRKTMKV